DGMLGGLIKSGKQITLVNNRYHAVMHHYPYDPKTGYLLALAPDDELSEEDKKIAGKQRTTFEFEYGTFSYFERIPESDFESNVSGLEYKEQLTKGSVENISASS